jgi:hypothetical protein
MLGYDANYEFFAYSFLGKAKSTTFFFLLLSMPFKMQLSCIIVGIKVSNRFFQKHCSFMGYI